MTRFTDAVVAGAGRIKAEWQWLRYFAVVLPLAPLLLLSHCC